MVKKNNDDIAIVICGLFGATLFYIAHMSNVGNNLDQFYLNIVPIVIIITSVMIAGYTYKKNKQ